ncbi:MAG: leucine-rich repeat domain-containing protein, partial [Scytolyngbya sp. HA4215-MV1]|nr:leucine-rich repeat domain-containing protein [Scytolyngbya sp. HA4215-MV1]
NSLSTLPPEIVQLRSLQSLELSNNSLSTLPPEIVQLTSLQSLYLRNNSLSTLPPEIVQLRSLQSLYLGSNALSTLPPEIVQLKSLQSLDLSSNALSTLPPEIRQMAALKTLDLRGNPVPIPPELLGPKEPYLQPGDLETILSFYFQVQDPDATEPLYEAKLLIVGEGEAGKTSLAKKIKNEAYQLDQKEKTTEGIEVIRWEFPLPNGQAFRVNIWDFGGQEIYHATHQFFLTKRSLYALVADDRKENPNFHHWLSVVELLGGDSPVLIIKNEKQDRQCPINERQLRSEFKVEKFLATNLETNRGLADIKAAIQFYLVHLPHIGTPLPKIWVRVRAALENYAQHCHQISDEKYFDLCRQNGLRDRAEMLRLSSYLHDLGVCLHFQDDALLKKTVILKPEWGTTAVYKVLDTPKVKTNYGRFTHADLTEIWQDRPYAELRDELLHLMMRFKLCYEIPGQPHHYIAPHLLKDEQPDYLNPWDTDNNLILRYQYDFMPKGILTRLIVEMHRWIEQQTLVWKTGVVLNNGRARAEVIEYNHRREAIVRVSGSDKKAWLAIIDHELNKIHASYDRLKYDTLVPCNCNTCKGSQEPYFYELSQLRERVSNRKQTIECGKPPYHEVKVLKLIDDVLDFETVIQGQPPSQELHRSGDIAIGTVETLVIQQGSHIMNPPPESTPPEKPVLLPSAFRNGMFYLLAAEVIFCLVAIFAGSLPLPSLIVVVIATVLIFVLIGVFQLRADDRLSEKTTGELVTLVIEQLPVLGGIFRQILRLFGKG